MSVQFSDHARTRLLQRAHVGGGPLPQPEQVWDESIPVGVPDVDGQGRLHPPTGTLLVVHGDSVATVLYPDESRMHDDHLKVCDECGLRYDPSEGDCQWHEPDDPVWGDE